MSRQLLTGDLTNAEIGMTITIRSEHRTEDRHAWIVRGQLLMTVHPSSG